MMYPDKEWRARLARPDEGVRASMAPGALEGTTDYPLIP